jgi:hypothetical protein
MRAGRIKLNLVPKIKLQSRLTKACYKTASFLTVAVICNNENDFFNITRFLTVYDLSGYT